MTAMAILAANSKHIKILLRGLHKAAILPASHVSVRVNSSSAVECEAGSKARQQYMNAAIQGTSSASTAPVQYSICFRLPGLKSVMRRSGLLAQKEVGHSRWLES
jgi:hypothetical protein